MAEPAPERFEGERRRLAGMLPGADISPRGGSGSACGDEVAIVALVDDLDGPIPVLVERGGYRHCPEHDAPGLRTLVAPGFRLVLSPARASGSSGSSAS